MHALINLTPAAFSIRTLPACYLSFNFENFFFLFFKKELSFQNLLISLSVKKMYIFFFKVMSSLEAYLFPFDSKTERLSSYSHNENSLSSGSSGRFTTFEQES